MTRISRPDEIKPYAWTMEIEDNIIPNNSSKECKVGREAKWIDDGVKVDIQRNIHTEWRNKKQSKER